MRVRLLPPSSTELPAFNPIQSPAAVTQILLLANPHKVPDHITLPQISILSEFRTWYMVFMNGASVCQATDVKADRLSPHVTGEGAFALQADL